MLFAATENGGLTMRLIDADALQRKICGAKCGCEYEDCGNEGDCAFDHFIFHAPTIEAELVVRCRDCKHSWEDISGLCCSHGVCVDLTVPGDFYCAYGERAEVTIICQSCGAMMDGEP